MLDGATGNIIVYNGELYNFRELRQSLVQEGVSFKSECDTEVVLKAYARWGCSALDHFIGMFAFAIWDARKGGVFVARDRLGIKPLYYFQNAGTFAFASRLGALTEHPRCPRQVSTTALRRYFQLGFVPNPLSIFESVFKLMPGHTLWIAADAPGKDIEVKQSPYWKIGPRSRAGDITLDEQAESLEPLLADAVNKRLIADVPVGVLLSGGIDSSAVASLTATRASDLCAFSIGFDDARFDELDAARKTAKKLGLEHHTAIMSSSDLLDYLPRFGNSFDEPFADPSALPTLAVSELARQKVTVVLTGDGGDELFGGYPIYRHLEHIAGLFRLPASFRRAIAAALRVAPGRRVRLLGGALAMADAARAFLFMRSISKSIDLPLSRAVKAEEPAWIYEDMLWGTHPDGIARAAAEFDMRYYMSDGILQKVDVASMSYGLEARVPLLDHRIIELAGTFPGSGSGKAVLRRVLAKHMPDFDFNRPKQGFSIPLARWIREDLRDHFEELLAPAELAKAPYLDSRMVNDLLTMHIANKCDANRILWAVLCYVQWCTIFRPTG